MQAGLMQNNKQWKLTALKPKPFKSSIPQKIYIDLAKPKSGAGSY